MPERRALRGVCVYHDQQKTAGTSEASTHSLSPHLVFSSSRATAPGVSLVFSSCTQTRSFYSHYIPIARPQQSQDAKLTWGRKRVKEGGEGGGGGTHPPELVLGLGLLKTRVLPFPAMSPRAGGRAPGETVSRPFPEGNG